MKDPTANLKMIKAVQLKMEATCSEKEVTLSSFVFSLCCCLQTIVWSCILDCFVKLLMCYVTWLVYCLGLFLFCFLLPLLWFLGESVTLCFFKAHPWFLWLKTDSGKF